MKRFFPVIFLLALPLLAHSQKKQKITGTDKVITVSTEFGEMIILLYDKTPRHKENFIKLASEGFYNGTTFHRIIKDFMIQGGDPNSKDDNPNNDGQGGPGYTIPAEIHPDLKHVKGAVAAARMGDQVNPERASSGSQFYIVQNADGTPFLDNTYTVFGQVIKGIEVVDKIVEQKKDGRDRPISDIKMTISVKEVKKKNIIKEYGCEKFYGL